MARLKFIGVVLLIMIMVGSCKRDTVESGYGVILFKIPTKADTSQSDSAVVMNFSNGYRRGFALDEPVLLGSEVYSASLDAFGYEGVELGYHFVNFSGEKVLDLDMPYKLIETRIDDNENLLIGIVNDPALDVTTIVAYDFKKAEEVHRYELDKSYPVSLCSSAYNPDSSTYFFFSASTLVSVNVKTGKIRTFAIDYHPVLTVYNHKANRLVVMVNIVNDTVLTNMKVLGIDPVSGEILSSATTDIKVTAACATGYDYDKDALVVYTLEYADGEETGVIKFIDVNTGATIEEHAVGCANRVLFWRD